MRKKPQCYRCWNQRAKKLCKMLKIWFVLFILGMTSLQAETFSQIKKVSLDVKNETLLSVLDLLQERSGYTFLFSGDDVKNVSGISLNVVDHTVADVLRKCLEGTGLSYEMEKNLIVLKKNNLVTPSEKIVLKGQVKDGKGELLPGVTVLIKGTMLGMTTDINGRFRLEISQIKNIVLVFSFVGMEKKEVLYQGQQELLVVMQEDVKQMEEAVVTGYFTQSKGSYTGAASTFTREMLMQAGNQNLLTSLQNIDPTFLQIENNLDGSNPNKLPDFEIRGTSSIPGLDDEYKGNPNMPMFIMDGFEVSAQVVFDMDQNRVEAVTILKDASATAVYGSRASNGVVVITTRAPESGKLSVTYSGDASFFVADLSAYDLLSAKEKLQLEINAGFYNTAGKTMDQAEKIMDVYNERHKAIRKGYDTYWLDKPLYSVAVGHKHSLLIEGGDKALRYSLTVNYNNQPGQMKESARNRMGISTTLQYNYHSFIFKNQLSYSDVKGKNSPYGSFSVYARLNPYWIPEDQDGNLKYILEKGNAIHYEPVYNPLYNATLNLVNTEKYGELINNFSIDWTPVENLLLKGAFAITQKKEEEDVFKPAKHTSFANGKFDRKGAYSATRGEFFSYNVNLIANYFKKIQNHILALNAGMNLSETTASSIKVEAQGFPNETMDHINFATYYQENGKPGGSETTTRLIGFLGNLNYSYDQRYLLDLSFRTDASSVFGVDKRWAPFWSAGIGWNIHNESFFKESGIFDLFKIRATYGETGSVNFSPYQAITMYEFIAGEQYEFSVPASVKAMGNPNLGWQKTLQTNFGIDLALLDSRVMVSANVYNKLSKDVLTSITLAPSTGFGTYMDNLGEVENRGFDVSLKLGLIKNKTRKIYWNINGSAVANKNKLKKMSNALKAFNDKQNEGISSTPVLRLVEGESMNSIWVNRSYGVDPASGNEVFITSQGTVSDKWSDENYVIGGDKDPKVRGNFGTNFTWEGFQLNAIFRYSCGRDVYNSTLVNRVQDADIRDNVDRRVFEDRWLEPGDRVNFTGYEGGFNTGRKTRPTSRFVQKENYMELATLNVSYNMDQELIRKWGLQQLRFLFYMNDVFRVSSVKIERGIDFPFARNFTFGLVAKF